MAKSNRPIIVFLDSLEQLSPTENAHLVAWLPRILPSHVHVVVSTLKDDRYACLGSLRVNMLITIITSVSELYFTAKNSFTQFLNSVFI